MAQVQGTIFKGAQGESLLAIQLALPPLSADSDKCWVQVIPGEGTFDGYQGGGFKLTAEVVDKVVENFGKHTTPVKVDYEHDSHKHDLLGPKIASGKILDLEKRDGDEGAQLWALCEWTKRAAEYIRNDEYSFSSPVIDFEHKDRRTNEDQGATLLSLALTDTPFLDAQQPIQLSLFTARKAGASQGPVAMAETAEEEKPAELTEGSDEEETAELTEGDGEEPKEMADGDPEPDATALLDALMTATSTDKAALIAALGELADPIAKMVNDVLDKDGSAAELSAVSAAEKAELKADAQGAKIAQLSQEVARLKRADDGRSSREKAERDAANEATIVQLVSDGVLHDSKRASALKLLTSDPRSFADIYQGEHAPKAVAIGTSQANPDADKAPAVVQLSDLSEQEQSLAKMFISSRLDGGDQQKCIQRVVARRSN